MEKTITIGGKDVRLSNNISWAMIYRNQFGQDIVPTILPMIAGMVAVVGGLISEAAEPNRITIKDLAKLADGDALIDALGHIGAAEFVDFIHITWSMAKVCDDNLPEPERWVRQFDQFPLDVIAPEVFGLILDGIVSSKNRQRLKDLKKAIQPITESTQIASSLPVSSEG